MIIFNENVYIWLQISMKWIYKELLKDLSTCYLRIYQNLKQEHAQNT